MSFYIKKDHLVANLASFLIAGISGIAINILIIRLYNADILGLFNQCLAIFFILSQITTFGIHHSVLSNIPISNRKDLVLATGILAVAIISIIVSIFSFFLLRFGFEMMNFDDLQNSMVFIAPSLILFSLNKVMIAAINGQGRLNLFAVVSSMRLVLMIFGLIMHYFFSFGLPKIAILIPFAEFGVFVFLVIAHKDCFVRYDPKETYDWIRKHIAFGRYALFSGLIVELNTKVDIVILTLFVDRVSIGVYSFATMLGEGFYLLISVFKNLNSKNLSLYLFNSQEVKNPIRDSNIKFVILFIYLVGIVSICLFKPFAIITTDDYMISERGFWVYAIYSISLIISARYLLIDNILILAKKPKLDNYVRIASLLTNITLCLVLVPFLGIYGAVLALGVSILANATTIRYFIKKGKHIPQPITSSHFYENTKP